MKKSPKQYRPRFTLEEINQLLGWYKGEFTGAAKLRHKLLRIKRKFKQNKS